ncbi:MAG: hypothetical protein HQK77_19100, partial [Desulfobacterales bacterium]|nr:hypothetical protein [Desulfobacterales bacterium]
KDKVEAQGYTVNELKVRLENYERKAFDFLREIHPFFSGGSAFQFSSMLDPTTFYESVNKELRTLHGYTGIVILWDEFGLKMEEVVKDPSGKEGLLLQEFAECCNSSEENQLHLYLFCHRSLKEYHDISKTANMSKHQQIEADLRKIEGRFKQFILKSTDVETFQLIDAVIVQDQKSPEWLKLLNTFESYFQRISVTTSRLNYFTGFSSDELKTTVIYGTFPLHPMAVFSLPALSEKVAQNNRTLFTCLCEDEPGSFRRFLSKTSLDHKKLKPDMFTVDMLWDYFANDVKQQERTYSIYRDFELLKTRLYDNETLGLRILKAVSVFRVFNPTRFKITAEILYYSLDIAPEDKDFFDQELKRYSDLKNENHILMCMPSDGSYRPAVSSSTETLIQKLRKILVDTPEKLNQQPVQYLKTLLPGMPGTYSCEATSYGDEFGIYRSLAIEPVSMYQIRERLHILTKDLGAGSFQDGLIAVVMCCNSAEIEETLQIATQELAQEKYQQLLIGIPKSPVQFFDLLMEHQALAYLKQHEASLYAEGGELHEEWRVWNDDKFTQLKDNIGNLFTPEKQMIDYYWQAQLYSIQNNRQLKQLTSQVMRHVFPYTPVVGESKLNLDDFGGGWGYRKDCRDIVLKLIKNDAAENLWQETSANQKHIINLTLKNNCLLTKNQIGEYVLEKPNEEEHVGGAKIWDCIMDYIKKARSVPVEMDKMVNKLRKPPFGLKCRAMPIFFAAVAHNELALGNISFEYQRSANHIERIATFENDTIEKIFINPEKYKMVYVNVSSNQKELISGLAHIFNVTLTPADTPLERVKKVGEGIGAWWRGLSKHTQISEGISDSAKIVRDYMFRPLAVLEPDPHQILLKDVFEQVFDVSEKVQQAKVKMVIAPIKDEIEALLPKLKQRILVEYKNVFRASDVPEDVSLKASDVYSDWFNSLPEEKKNAIYNGETAFLINETRKQEIVDDELLLRVAHKICGLDLTSWSDEMVLKFSGKLDSIKQNVERYVPVVPIPTVNPSNPIIPPAPGYVSFTLTIKDKINQRTFEPVDNISSNAQALENMLNVTVDQIGRGLDEKEKMTVLCNFINKHVFGLN